MVKFINFLQSLWNNVVICLSALPQPTLLLWTLYQQVLADVTVLGKTKFSSVSNKSLSHGKIKLRLFSHVDSFTLYWASWCLFFLMIRLNGICLLILTHEHLVPEVSLFKENSQILLAYSSLQHNTVCLIHQNYAIWTPCFQFWHATLSSQFSFC